MSNETLFSIGDVARLFHISVSSLRHYENIGLLAPERTDPDTLYRYYSTRQFEALNTIRYLRALDMPLGEIKDFLNNRDVDRMEEKLRQQHAAVIQKQQELERIQRKIENRLHALQTAKEAVLDQVELVTAPPCRVDWMGTSLKISEFLDMETPIRALEHNGGEAVVFLGKVGVSISKAHLQSREFGRYDGIFLLLDEEDRYSGAVHTLPETLCLRLRFRGSHADAPAQYEKLLDYAQNHAFKVGGFSREITMIDYGITNDTEKFLTEIWIPVEK